MDRRISILRTLACMMVVVLHIATNLLGTYDQNWMAGNVYDSFTRACVPIFIMISGATLLSRHEPLSVYFRKRALRIIPPLLFWSVFYLAWRTFSGEHIDNWMLAIFKGPTMYHLWYFYALIGMYLFIPVLRIFFRGSSKNEQIWFIWIWLAVCSLIPSAQILLDYRYNIGHFLEEIDPVRIFDLNYYSGLAGYLVLGAFAASSKSSTKTGLFIFLAGTATTIALRVGCAYYGKSSDFFGDNYSPSLIAAGYGLFIAIMSMKPGPSPKLLITLGECSLGIYGLHVFIIQFVMKQGITLNMINPWIMIPLLSSTVFFITFGIVYLLRLVKPLAHVI
jgi:surface polysaccharide O-acyltransferase-like enzyme